MPGKARRPFKSAMHWEIRNMICAGYTWGGSSACQVRRGVHLNPQCIGDIHNIRPICVGYTWGGSSACQVRQCIKDLNGRLALPGTHSYLPT